MQQSKVQFTVLTVLGVFAVYSVWTSTSTQSRFSTIQKGSSLLIAQGRTSGHADTTLEANSQLLWDTAQFERKRLIQNVCSRYNLSRPLRKVLDNRKNTIFFSVDDVHRIVLFRTPKVGSTTWSGIISHASGADKNYYAMNKTSSKTFILNSFTKKERLFRLKNYRKIFFVRHPYERLVSAFYNKFYSDLEGIFQNYQVKLGSEIVQLYRNISEASAPPAGYNITFQELVRYLTDGYHIDEHFEPIYKISHACSISYDFIGHYENFLEDSLAILERINITVKNLPWRNKSSNDPDKVRRLCTSLDAELKRKLYDLFRVDFEMFGYEDYLEDST